MKKMPFISFLLTLAFVNFVQVDENKNEKALHAINKIRSESRNCGPSVMSSSSALRLDSSLTHAAHLHAVDIYQNQLASHKGSDGSTPFSRVKRYTDIYTRVGEAIAFTEEDFNSALDLLINSPQHCKIIMDNNYSHFGISSIEGTVENSTKGFVLVFGGTTQ